MVEIVESVMIVEMVLIVLTVLNRFESWKAGKHESQEA
jgi:hypothetical protein